MLDRVKTVARWALDDAITSALLAHSHLEPTGDEDAGLLASEIAGCLVAALTVARDAQPKVRLKLWDALHTLLGYATTAGLEDVAKAGQQIMGQHNHRGWPSGAQGRYTPEQKTIVQDLRRQGLSMREIVKRTGIPKSSVFRIAAGAPK